jgi:PKD repeat protein
MAKGFCNSRGALLGTALVALVACGDGDKGEVTIDSTPIVSINATTTTGIAPLTVQFFSTVSGGNGPLQWAWQFGEGSTSNQPNPAHTFEAAGSPYTVSLTVTDDDGDTGTSSILIAVGSNEEPTVMASATPTSGAAPLTVDFDCAVAGGNQPVHVSWHFGEGTADTAAITSHTYTAAGTYRARCRAVDADGDMATESIDIVVGTDSIPDAVISAAPTSGRAPLTAEFVGIAIGGDSPITYEWNFGDGTTDTGANVSHTYTDPGFYVVVLTVTDSDGDSDAATFTMTVEATDLAPVVVADVVAGTCAVTGLTRVELDATGSLDPEGAALRYSWAFVTVPPGSMVSFNNPSVANPTFVPDTDGTYQMRVFVSDGTNMAASDILSIESSGPTAIVSVAGDDQTGGVGTTLPADIEVEVKNACGALVASAAVEWIGVNASTDPAVSFTDGSGRAATSVTLGGELGTASVTATLLGTGSIVTFTFTAVAGPVAQILMDDVGPVPVDATTPVTITFRATDAYGNLVTEPVSFDVNIGLLPTSATIDDDGDDDCTTGGVARTSLTTSDGVATAQVCNTTVEDVYVAVENVVAPGAGTVRVGGRVTWRSDDFETDTGQYQTIGIRNMWELGPPTYPPGLTGYSPVQVRGTVLGGELDTSGGFFGDTTMLQTRVDTTYPIGEVYSTTLELNHFHELEYSQSVNCYSNAQLWAGCYGCTLLLPEGGYNGNDCYFTGVAGFVGTNEDFAPVRFDLAGSAGTAFDLYWTVTFYEQSGGAGWYIDDLRLWGMVQYPRIRFVAGAPVDARVLAESSGVVQACAPVTISGSLIDEFGNMSNASGVEISLTATGNGEFIAGLVGDDFTPGTPPSTATIETVNGRFSVLIADTAATAEDVTVTAAITGYPVGAEGTTIATFNDPLVAENAVPGACADGVDNDCDGLIDCADPDCSGEPECQFEICDNGLDDNSNGLTDCEDPQCHYTPECESMLIPGSCNGIDDEDVYGVYGVDEFACNCVNTTGCDDIDFGDFGGPYVCQIGLGPLTPTGRPFCAPDCRLFDWCSLEGFQCDIGTGECEF